MSKALPVDLVILLDLNFTLVENSLLKREQSGLSYAEKIGYELYRQWLVDLVKPRTVVLCTVRHERYQVVTLERILLQTGWQPALTLFNPDGNEHRGDIIKRRYLLDHLFPRFGQPDERPYLAIESLAAARQMYATFGITAVRQQDCRRGLPLP